VRPLALQRPEQGFLRKLHGVALAMQGKDARVELEAAARLLPADPEVHYYLGNALQAHGAAAAAAASQRRALALKEDFPEAHNQLGLCLVALHEPAAALASFRRALELAPRFAAALGNLGDALYRDGRPAAAVAAYRRMLQLEPDSSIGHNHLGNALVGLGEFAAAIASYRRAIALRPDFPDPWSNLGHALRAVGQLDEAAAAARRGLELRADFPEAARNLGNALFDLGHVEAAEAAFRRALDLRPDHAEVHLALASALRRQGRGAAAEACARRALELKPQSAEILTFLAELEADRGRFAEAATLAERAVAIDPELPEGWAAVPRYRRMRADDAAWLAAAERVLARRLGLGHEIELRFAIGKYFDDLGDYDRAFAAWRHANELARRHGARYDRGAHERRVEAVMAGFDAAWLERTRAAALPSERPVFIVGMPRSGTTLVEQILASHPAVFGAGELIYWNVAADRYSAANGAGATTGGAVPLLAELGADYLKELQQRAPAAARVIDKMPANFMNLGLIHAALPRARVIHLQRDPRAVALSIFAQNFSQVHAYAADLEDIAHYFGQYRRLMTHWHRTLPAGSILDLRYEELLREPEAGTRRLLDHLGLPWDARCLEFQDTRRTVLTASSWQVRQKIDANAADRWRRYEKYLIPVQGLHPGD